MCNKVIETDDDDELLEHYLNEIKQIMNDDATAATEELTDEDSFEDDNSWEEYEYSIPTPKTQYDERTDLIPFARLLIRMINDTPSMRLLRALFDSGGTGAMIHKRALPSSCTPTLLQTPVASNTIEGSFTTKTSVRLKDMTLPEFDKNKKIDNHTACVFDGPCKYDLILGRDFLHKAGIKLDFELKLVQWMDHTVPMKQLTSDDTSDANVEREMNYIFDDHATEIADSKYEQVQPSEVAAKQTHLTPEQRKDLEALLSKFPRLFSGELGKYPHKKVHIELEPGAKPVHARPYAVPRAHEGVFKKELDHLCKLGVLRKCGATEWASPTFIVPKKLLPGETAPRVRWASDFRELNKVIRRRVYPLPRIQEVLTKRPGYEFLTKLDMSMQYCTFEMTEEAKELLTIVTPHGKYQYNRLAMGVSIAPDTAQEIMEDVMRGLKDVDVYIDDIGAFSLTWKQHLRTLEEVLRRLEDNGFTVNPLKCEWGVKETDWLGYWLTPKGLKPWKKKVEGILKMDKPRNLKQLRAFIGAVNYHRDLWPRRAHALKPLTDLTGKTIFEWTDEHTKAFEEMRALVAADALMRCPDHNVPFDIHTDSSDYQLGACIMQRGVPVACHSKKLTSSQQNYSTLQKELLAVVMTLSTFRTMLLGAELNIHTDHKNLTFKTLTSQQALRWRLFLEEYDANYHCIEGKENVLADAFSRLPRKEGQSADDQPQTEESLHFGMDEEMMDCFLNFPINVGQQTDRSPLDMRWTQEVQFEDDRLQQLRNNQPHLFPIKHIDNVAVMCFRIEPTLPEHEWRICIPTSTLDETIRWFHMILGHSGITRTYDAIRRMYHHPHLKRSCIDFECEICEENKLYGAGFGQLPPREATMMPWEEVHADLIGPWKVRLSDGRDIYFNALTIIDPVTDLVELIRVNNKTAKHVQQQFQNCWLSRHPWPKRCVHDNGGEFIGEEFIELMRPANIEDKPTASRNPTANAICERMHQTVGNVLRTSLRGHPPDNIDDAATIIDSALATAMHATRSAASRSLNHQTPGSIAFFRDMFLNVPFIADLQTLKDRRQLIIDENLRRQNARRRHHDYTIGDRVWIKEVDPAKLDPRGHGPYPITRVHANGTVTVQRRPHVTERINLRRIYPHRAAHQ